MKRLLLFLTIIAMLTSCSIVKRTYVYDYREKIELIKTNFPEIYDLYCRGEVIIDNVYTYEKDGIKRVHISYHYR